MPGSSNDGLNSFTKLTAWQAGHKLVIATLSMCEQLPPQNPLRNQMERAVISITSNVAEGFGRQSKADKKHFYVMARGSAYELQNQLLVARDTGKITTSTFSRLAELSLDSIRLLHGLIRALNKPGDTNS